ncbi:MAG: sulfite reductase (NADPH) flavoprotein alpha-component [Cocleimonas sp.]|jgi:sulfite reductase (NADPH) flavoprotein alpha-component
MTILNQQQIEKVSAAVDGLDSMQLAWVSGYFSGLSAQPGNSLQNSIANSIEQSSPAPKAGEKITVLYGSQTGNSKNIAESLHTALELNGNQAELKNLLDYRPQQLKKEQKVIVVISTQGNGEAPDEALGFYKFITGDRAPRLENLEFTVLGLGDSSYDDYCQTGKDVDSALENLGAKRFHDRIDVDLDFEDDVITWKKDILSKSEPKADTVVSFAPKFGTGTTEITTEIYSEANPYHAEILNIVDLTTAESTQNAYHIELGVEADGLSYKAGDIIAVLPDNQDKLVDAIISKLDYNANETVTIKKGQFELRTAFKHHLEISNLTANVIKTYAGFIKSESLQTLLDDKESIKDYLNGSDLLNLVTDYPGEISTQDLVASLRPLISRQYSIASSEKIHEEEVHILIKPVTYSLLHNKDEDDRKHLGVASNWLKDKQLGDTVPVHIKSNSGFKLPESSDEKIIMIGAGTGVAPFRSFLYERENQGANGNSWLFFGEQRFRSDFLYQTEWQKFLKDGTLEKMNVAFSRDQDEKVYIQHKLLEEAANVYEWIEQGATLYICGDINNLAKDVHNTLVQIISEQSGKSLEDAETQLDDMKISKKYQRDVY